MKSNKFQTLCKNKFHFLIKDYGCNLKSYERREFDEQLIFLNLTTGIIVVHRIFEESICVMICRLVKGEIPKYPIFVKPDTALNQFNFLDLIKINDEKLYDYLISLSGRKVLKTAIQEYATALKNYGKDILKGDFESFIKLEGIVRKR